MNAHLKAAEAGMRLSQLSHDQEAGANKVAEAISNLIRQHPASKDDAVVGMEALLRVVAWIVGNTYLDPKEAEIAGDLVGHNIKTLIPLYRQGALN